MPATPSAHLFRFVLAAVLLAPLPLAANRPWAWSLLALWTAVALLAWGVLVARGRVRAPVPLARVLPVALPFALAWAWAVAQATLPAGGLAHPLWAEAARALGHEGVTARSGTISLDPAASLTAAMRLACYAGIFWLGLQLGRERGRARLGLRAVAIAAMAYGAYGLVVYFSGNATILWMPKWAYEHDLTATFVNRNAFGAYAGLGLLCCLALLIHTLRLGSGGDARDVVENLLGHGVPWAIGLSGLSTALMLSHSRGALLSTGLGVLALLAALAFGRVIPPRRMAALSGLVLVVGLFAALIGGEATVNRLAEAGNAVDDRPDLYRLTLGAIAQTPLLGHGLGTFEGAFQIYRDASLPLPVVYDYGHNVWLETAMDLGVPGAILLFAAPAAAMVLCLRGLRRRHRDHLYPAVAVAATILLGAHGLVDFSVQMPALAATLAFLLGLGVAQSWNAGEFSSGRRDEPEA